MKAYILKHKKVSIAVAVLALILIYFLYMSVSGSTTTTKYVLGTVEKGTLVTSISGTGQVSNSNQVDIKPKVSGDIISVKVVSGQKVKKGDIIAQLDSKDAQKTVRDAQINLQSAQLSLQKLQQPADQSTLLSSQNSLASAELSKQTAQDNLLEAYSSGFNSVADALNSMPSVIRDVNDILYTYGHSAYLEDSQVQAVVGSQGVAYKLQAGVEFDNAKNSYDKLVVEYRSISRDSSQDKIESILKEANDTITQLSVGVKDLNNTIKLINGKFSSTNRPAQITKDLTVLDGYTATINSAISSITGAIQDIKDSKNAIVNADLSIAERKASLGKVEVGTDTLDLQSSQLSVAQRQNALRDARDTLSEYTIRAPFDGVIAKVTATVADTGSPSTAVATIVTADQIATLTLNEVDIAKVKVGNKATMTFDALSDLTISGEVADLDSLGTVSQGVVTYTVKIKFDTNNDQVKPGMSVSASIITDSKADVLLVPSSAIKTTNGNSFVQVIDGIDSTTALESTSGIESDTAPRSVQVQIGNSNDTETEIISGLNEGNIIVTRTITSSAATKTTASATSLLGGNRTSGAGAATRVVR